MEYYLRVERNIVVMNSNARVKSDIFILPESAVVYKGRCLAGGVDLYFPTAILPMRKLFLSRYSVRDLLLILGSLLYFIETKFKARRCKSLFTNLKITTQENLCKIYNRKTM